MNIGAPWPSLNEAEARVLGLQKKLHQWALADGQRRFDDVFNLVCDPAFLVVAWQRVRGNKGARTAGVDGIAPRSIGEDADAFLMGLRAQLKALQFRALPVRQTSIPKANGKFRRLGIPVTADRVVQASLKLVMEPIFEADFKPCSYGFRPNRRAQDAIAEIHFLSKPSLKYDWVFEGDIKACFDEIDHTALMDRVRHRITDRRILALIKAFLKAGLLTEAGQPRKTITGTPQGGILSPLLANIALSVLDEHFTDKWDALGPYWMRSKHRRAGHPVMRLIRYADDFVVMVSGQRSDTDALRHEVGGVLFSMGLSLSEEKTRIVHMDEGFDFLGWHIQRRRWRGRCEKRATYTYPSKQSLLSVMVKVRSLTRRSKHHSLTELIQALNRVLRGWCNYFRHGVSSRTFSYLDHFTFWRIVGWLRKRHLGLNWGTLHRRYLPGWEVRESSSELFRPARVEIVRYRYRGSRIPTPWATEALA